MLFGRHLDTVYKHLDKKLLLRRYQRRPMATHTTCADLSRFSVSNKVWQQVYGRFDQTIAPLLIEILKFSVILRFFADSHLAQYYWWLIGMIWFVTN